MQHLVQINNEKKQNTCRVEFIVNTRKWEIHKTDLKGMFQCH